MNKKNEKIIIYYNRNGEDIIDETDGAVCACYERKEIGNSKEYIDVFSILFDNNGLLFSEKNSKLKNNNRERFKFKRVNQECFGSYLRYLRTKDEKSWRLANRKAIENV